jgi:LytS/YehU family sensor histidine kinase
VREDRREAATDTLARLGDLFRETFGNVKRHEIPLRDELKFVDAYLDIERARFSDRLSVRVDVQPGALDALLPSMALQPLVENAIRHGVAPSRSAGRIEIAAHRSNGTLMLEVRDDGPGLTGGAPAREGVGLSNTRARLLQMYGPTSRMELANVGAGGGTNVRLTIPYRPAPVGAEAGEETHE